MKSSIFGLRLARVALLCAIVTAGAASARSDDIVVSEKQMQALGIELIPLASTGTRAVATFPAQIVTAADGELVVSAPVAGLVVQLYVQVNQPVRQGTPLLRIAGAELGQQQLQLLQAVSRAGLARQAASRETALFDEGIIPMRRVQEAKATLAENEAALQQARSALRLSGMADSVIDQIAASGKPVDGVTLTAARAGVVSKMNATPGQRVEAASPLLHLVQTDKLLLDVQIPVDVAASWSPGMKIKLQGLAATARVLGISPTVSPGSQTLSVRAAIESGGSNLRAGESVAVELPLISGKGARDVPLVAVAHDGDRAVVFVRNARGFTARPVTVLASAGQRLSVQGELKDGEHIAVSGVVALKGAWLDDKGGK